MFINYYKHFYLDKLKLFEKTDFIFNIVIFVIYNLFLLINNKSFISVYIKNTV